MNGILSRVITPFPDKASEFKEFQQASDTALLFTLHNQRGLVAEAEFAGYQEDAPCRIRVSLVRESSCGNRRTHHLVGWIV